ncbi:hypothetical protein BaRGS_00003177 [Batillaria attramentaria]|uniref:Uncharacterized protein n=1 Tax=Batillaria attramentaria TaxID=370345 RepID=A0ABD0M1F3_9CAEN
MSNSHAATNGVGGRAAVREVDSSITLLKDPLHVKREACACEHYQCYWRFTQGCDCCIAQQPKGRAAPREVDSSQTLLNQQLEGKRLVHECPCEDHFCYWKFHQGCRCCLPQPKERAAPSEQEELHVKRDSCPCEKDICYWKFHHGCRCCMPEPAPVPVSPVEG